MGTPFLRAPHVEGSSRAPQSTSPNAALLIDFDNVTMGMRSDLSKELRNLLNSDIIKGKVAVQRAYADWRRYPQYIVPLSENSVDLIFAPAYGSSKKNATDIRMAIDAVELIFVRPEIGTFILLTGDSDFSAVVLKLKEYGKYVIGVGIQESSSDLLVQNCDEYYSYTALTGLRKAGDHDARPSDAWVLVEQALDQMVKRKDVMRSDRLKQVMLELDPGFDEGGLGFSKFSRFLTEASSRGLIQLQKMENGQYEVGPPRAKGGSEDGARSESRREDRPRREERDRGRDRGGRSAVAEKASEAPPQPPVEQAPPEVAASTAAVGTGDPLQEAYRLLRDAVSALAGEEKRDAVRDSDVKRKMLALRPAFDEAELGFGKFSRFLRQAHDHEVVDLRKGENGNYEVALHGAASASPAEEGQGGADRPSAPDETRPAAPEARKEAAAAPTAPAPDRRLRPRTSRRGGKDDGPPPLLEGQAFTAAGAVPPPAPAPEAKEEPAAPASSAPREGDGGETGKRKGRGTRRGRGEGGKGKEKAPAAEVKGTGSPPRGKEREPRKAPSSTTVTVGGRSVDPAAMGLPVEREEVVRYFTTSYKGVGKKTAETLWDSFGERLYAVMQGEPDRVRKTIPVARAELVLEAWQDDLAIRLAQSAPTPTSQVAAKAKEQAAARRRTRPRKPSPRGGGRGRGSGGA